MSIMIGGVSVGGALAAGAATAAAGAAVSYGASALMGGKGGGAGGAGSAGGGGGVDKKYTERAKKESNKFLKNSNKAIDRLRADQEAANAAYRAAGAANSNEFMGRINTAIGSAPDYWTTVNQAVQGKDVVRNEFDAKAATLAEDSANQALNWNEANQSRMIAFSQALQKANEQSAMEGAFAANPALKGLIGQLGRNAMSDARGIISAEVAAMSARNAAQTSLGAGTGFGSELNRNLSFVRDFGIRDDTRNRAVQNTAILQNQIVNPILEGTKVNSFDTAKWMGLDTSQVLDTNRQTLTNSTQMGLDRWDDMLRAGEITLGTRSEAATYDYGQKMGMEGNIYTQSSSTFNNIANLRTSTLDKYMNARLGIVSQGWANEQARGVQAAENNAALVRSGVETAGTIAGAYFGSQKGQGNPLANDSTGGMTQGGGARNFWDGWFSSKPPADGSAAGYQH